ncbi:hypothetical protein [Variovorax paradoxus]|nr:hypothetical protein [Variovorax paradoxus]
MIFMLLQTSDFGRTASGGAGDGLLIGSNASPLPRMTSLDA